MRSRLKNVGLGQRHVGVALEMSAKERQLDVLAIEARGLGLKIDVAQSFTVTSTPLPMRPGPHDQVMFDPWIQALG